MSKSKPKTTAVAQTLEKKVAEKTASTLVEEAKKRLADLQAGKKKIKPLQSSNDLLIQGYLAQKSYLDSVARWYGSKAWWQKLALGAGILGSAALIGLVVQVALSLTITALCLCALTHLILSNHYQVEQAKIKHFGEDISDLEKDLKEELENLSAIEDKLNQVLVCLSEKEVLLAENTKQFESTITLLQSQVSALNKSANQLSENKTQLEACHGQLKQQFDFVEKELLEAQQELKTKVSQLGALHQEVNTLKEQLSVQKDEFGEISRVYQQRIESLEKVTTLFDEKIAQITGTNDESPEGLLAEHQEFAKEGEEILEDFEKFLAESEKLSEAANRHVRQPRLVASDNTLRSGI